MQIEKAKRHIEYEEQRKHAMEMQSRSTEDEIPTDGGEYFGSLL